MSYMRANDEHEEACALVGSVQQAEVSAASLADAESFEKWPGSS